MTNDRTEKSFTIRNHLLLLFKQPSLASSLVKNTMAGSCAYCAKPGSQYCATCKLTTYCSKACQKSDWKAHKHVCKAFNNFDKSARPSKDHHIAFFFPENDAIPQVVWLESYWLAPARCTITNSADVDKFLGAGKFNKAMTIEYNERTGKALDDLIDVHHHDDFLVNGSNLNQSIFKVAPNTYWRGPMLASCQVGQGLDALEHRDMNPTDFRHLIDHFAGYAYRIGMGANTVGKANVPEPKMEFLDGHEVQNRYPESNIAKIQKFNDIMHTEGLEAAVKSIPREKGDEKSFANLQKLVEEDKKKQKAKEQAEKS